MVPNPATHHICFEAFESLWSYKKDQNIEVWARLKRKFVFTDKIFGAK